MRIGEILMEQGYLTGGQLAQALDYQEGLKDKKRMGEILTALGFVAEDQILLALAGQLNLAVVDLATCYIDSAAVEKIPKQIALSYQVIAICADGGQLTVAVNDPVNLYALEDIRLVTNMRIKLVLAGKQAIDYAIDLHYSELEARSAVRNANQHAGISSTFFDEAFLALDQEQAPVVRLLNSLLLKGYNTNVSDIHIEPYEEETMIRMRRDGMLLPYITLSSTLHEALTARIKILAQMDIAEKRKPQDGHFHVMLEGIQLHIRVSFVPSLYGEKGVLRYLTANRKIDYSETFGMRAGQYEKMLNILSKPYGLVYFTGPTGSGKTTTLYSVLSYLSSRPVNIATIEDPIERNMKGISQIQVNPKAGITFESGLRALLRQDPDIIMVGETRDFDTASIAARAAITGHMVFSTLHTNDAVSTVIRLMDLGIEPYIAASALSGVVAQRLVKKVCIHCRESYRASSEEVRLLYPDESAEDPVVLHRGRGCHLCDGTGYRGRTAVYEILEVDSQLRRLITERADMSRLYAYARTVREMTGIKEEVRRLVLEGITDLREMEAVTAGQE